MATEEISHEQIPGVDPDTPLEEVLVTERPVWE